MKNNIGWISSLRGLSALLVFLSHIALPVNPEISFLIGRVGVVCFFLITGYLTVQTRSKRNTKQYMVNRFIRMYPTYWVLLSVLYLIKIDSISIKRYILNLTLFNEFLGEECIIGSSWMMPIQVVYFIVIALFGLQLFRLENNQSISLSIVFCNLLALVCSLVRYITAIPVPTAFFLLLALSFTGMKLVLRGKRNFIQNLLIYDVCMIVCAFLSYGSMWVYYVVAYNMGILIFLLVRRFNIYIEVLDAIGKVGFPLFLGTAITNELVEALCKYVMIRSIFKIVFQFVLAYVFAVLVNRYLESNLLKLGAQVEKKLE